MELMDISLERLYMAVHDLGYPAFDENTLGSVAINVSLFYYFVFSEELRTN